MEIHIVSPGDTLFSIARQYQVPASQIALDNGLSGQARLVVGQALVIQFPSQTHVVQPGETLSDIGRQYGLSQRQLYQNNPILQGRDSIYPGQTLVLSYRQQKIGSLETNGYAYPYISDRLLQSVLPYLSAMTPFTYGFTPQGNLVDLNDRQMIAMAQRMDVAPLMHLSTLTESGGFSNELAHMALTDVTLQKALIENVLLTMQDKGYRGLDVDFEFVYRQDAGLYAQFIRRMAERFNPLGYPVIVALAPKTSSDQPGLLYEGHDYAALGAAANRTLLMTYEWGYTYGPPMAVAPLPSVRRVAEYALTQIPAEKIWLGVPTYGYDWPLPFVQGQSKATSLSPQQALNLALAYGAEILYSDQSQAPWFRYTDRQGQIHEVWFEDARSIQAKLALTGEYGFSGVGYWNLMREFPQNWRVLNALYHIDAIGAGRQPNSL